MIHIWYIDNTDNLVLNLSSIGVNAFVYCYKLKAIDLGSSSLISLVNSIFYGCSMLSNLTVPSTVTTFEAGSVSGCTSLSTLKIKNSTPPTVLSDTFNSVNKTTCVLHVPIGSLAAYRAAQYWTEFINIIEDL